jgi:molybdopterin-guanine dinucleotide biosynthesis protein A
VRIVDRVAAALQPATGRIVIAARDAAAPSPLPGVPIIADAFPGTGGLAGIEAGLGIAEDLETDALVVAWDMPFVTEPLLTALWRQAVTHEYDVVLPASDSPHGFEPLCGFYAARVRPRLRAFLDDGGRAAHSFVSTLDRVHLMTPGDLEADGVADAARACLSVNSPADLERARALIEGRR